MIENLCDKNYHGNIPLRKLNNYALGTDRYIADWREQGTIQRDNDTVTNAARTLSSKDIKTYSSFDEALKDR